MVPVGLTTFGYHFEVTNRVSFTQDIAQPLTQELASRLSGGPSFIQDETPWNLPSNNWVEEDLGNPWSSPTNAYVEDTASTVASTVSVAESNLQGWGGFGFSIPASSIITGIGVQVRADTNSGTQNLVVTLQQNGSDPDLGNAKICLPSTSIATFTLGGEDDLWEGVTNNDISATIANSSTFGVGLQISNSLTAFDMRVDWIKMKLWYEYLP